MINPMDLTGKHILITGASSGIGQATAIQASKLGAKVTLVARREDALRETIQQMDNPELHAYYPFDMSNIEGIEGVVDKLVKEQGPLDGFLHSVGIGALRALKMKPRTAGSRSSAWHDEVSDLFQGYTPAGDQAHCAAYGQRGHHTH